MNNTRKEAVPRGAALDSQNRPSAVRRPTGEPENQSGFQPSQSQPPNDGACTKSTKAIVAGVPADVKAIRELRSVRSIPVADIVEVVAAGYPKFDRYLLSKVEHGDEYGIRLRDDAMATLMAKFAPEQRKRRSRDRHNKAKRIQARLSDDVYSRLQRTVAANNITIQALLEQLILNYIIEHSKGDSHD